jgi:AdoMet-dependent rRNA methyltransferase SPB1
VTREEIEAEKARLAAIDARPIKKVAEAKARKRKRLQVRLCCCVMPLVWFVV